MADRPRPGTKSERCVRLWNAGLTYSEIGEVLGWAKDTVGSCLAHWRKRMPLREGEPGNWAQTRSKAMAVRRGEWRGHRARREKSRWQHRFFRRLFEEGLSPDDLAGLLKIHRTTAEYYFECYHRRP